MKRALACMFVWALLVWALVAYAQTPASAGASTTADAGPSLPSDARDIFTLAARMNGLAGSDLKPWHIKVAYQIFDSGGKAQESGTYEEFWVSDKIYKRSYASDSFTQTDFGTDRGLFRSGNQNWPDLMTTQVRDYLVHPIPEDVDLHDNRLKKGGRTFDRENLQCVAVQPKYNNVIRVYNAPPFYPYVHYCFDPRHPMLRFDSQGNGVNDALYNHIILFQGRYVAKEVQVWSQRKPRLTLRVLTLENLPSGKKFAFMPSADAAGPLNGKTVLSTGLLDTMVRKRCSVESFFSIHHTDLSGSVVLQALVGKDGRVISAEPLSGPKVLQPVAAECARKYEFHPFLVQGEPVEVEGKLEVRLAVTSELPNDAR